ncbi:MAG: hypothetical protein P8076_04550 [Gammaproteobacteria bacterium]
MRVMVRGVLWSVLAVLLAGCGRELSGSYTQAGGAISSVAPDKLTFHDGKVDVSLLGTTTQADYEIKGDQVLLHFGPNTESLTLARNGCLNGGQLLGVFCKTGR